MKKPIYFIVVLLISKMTVYAQSFNKEIIEENKPIQLLGKINKQGLQTDPYNQWFSKGYEEYIPNQNIIDSLKTELKPYTITLFMGTWCGDSKREVPHFYHVLEKSGFSIDRLTTIAVDRSREAYKQSPGGEHEGLNIHRVPTFIFYKDGKEVNRIVESPKNTIEEDILSILKEKYTSKYSSVQLINEILVKNGSSYIINNIDNLIKNIKDSTDSLYELNTYANVLFYSNKKEEALAILELNAQLFSKNADVYTSLANKYAYINDTTKAIRYYKKSLEITDNKEIRGKIKELQTGLN